MLLTVVETLGTVMMAALLIAVMWASWQSWIAAVSFAPIAALIGLSLLAVPEIGWRIPISMIALGSALAVIGLAIAGHRVRLRRAEAARIPGARIRS